MAASIWEEHVRNCLNKDEKVVADALKCLVDGIKEDHLKLHEFVPILETDLTNPDPTQRSQGVKLLVDVITNIADVLQPTEVAFLVGFFCDRIGDNVLVTPHALRGLLALSPHVSGSDAVKITTTLFADIHNQSQVQQDRSSVYIILKTFMDKHLEDLKTLGVKFVLGFIQAMDGEKDPRNLMLVFSLVPRIVHNFPIDPLAEEFFEVLGCYFPVDFSPPQNDSHKISRQDLSSSLQASLGSCDQFAPFVLPLLIEKIDSDMPIAKLDGFILLSVCSESYGAETIQGYCDAFWKSIRREVLLGQVEEVQVAALSALKALMRTLAQAVTKAGGKSALTSFMSTVLKECQHHLSQPELLHAQPSQKLLEAVASSSHSACCIVVNSCIPLLLQQFTVHTQVNYRKTTIQILTSLIKICGEFANGESDSSPLMHLKASLLTLYFSLTSDPSTDLQNQAVEGLDALISTLDVQESKLVVSTLLNLAMEDTSVRIQCKASLSRVGQTKPHLITQDLVESVLTRLNRGPDFPTEDLNYHRILHVIPALCNSPEIINIVASKLFSQLEGSTIAQSENRAVHLFSCFEELTKVMIEQGTNSSLLHSAILVPLINFISKNPNLPLTLGPTSSLQAVCSAATRRLSVQESQDLLDSLVPQINIYRTKDFKMIGEQTSLMITLEAVIGNMRQEVTIRSVCGILGDLEEFMIRTKNSYLALSACRMWSSIINKLPQGEQLNSELERISQLLSYNISAEGSSSKMATEMWIWVTKALVMRGHSECNRYIDKLIELLDDAELGSTAASGFTTILSSSDVVLNPASHANVRIMYKQRFFQYTCPLLVDRFKLAPNDKKPPLLAAILQQIPLVPKQVVSTQVPTLFPLLVQALGTDNTEVASCTLKVLGEAIDNDLSTHALQEYLDDILPLLLQLTTQSTTNMDVRISSLKCIGSLSRRAPVHKLIPHKQQVILQLGKCLDNHKRLVRSEAVKARGLWFLVGDPGGKA